MNLFYDRYLEQIKADFPKSFEENDFRLLLNPNLISSQIFKISEAPLDLIKAFVSAIYKLRNSTDYQNRVCLTDPLFQDPSFVRPLNYAALMSFDFHLANGVHPKLIEINTNASSSLVTNQSYRVNNLHNPFSENFESDVVACFQNEFNLWKKTAQNLKSTLKVVAIIDENPPLQKMYVEFLLYKELFTRAGLTCVIADPKQLSLRSGRLVFQNSLEIDLVYNRHTDFYFADPENAHLREAYKKTYACFTPHPFEYALLADKQRLYELCTLPALLDILSIDERKLVQNVLLKSYDIFSSPDKDWFWKNKKSLFFKPKRSFGGKAGYRGQGVTQTVFANIKAGDYLAQEFAPPSETEVELEDKTRTTFKCDLRFYVYNGRIQLGVARLWRGQMTNIHSLGGGLTPLLVLP